jgi:hypothetical protein
MTAVLALAFLLHSCSASSSHQSAARLLIDNGSAFTGGDDAPATALPPPVLANNITPPTVAPSVQPEVDEGPLGNYGLSYVGGAGAQRRASHGPPLVAPGPRQSAVPAPAPAQACQTGIVLVPCPPFNGGASMGSSMAPASQWISWPGHGMSPAGHPMRAPFQGPVAQPVQLKSPSKALPPGAFQKAVPVPKQDLTFKPN